MDVTAFGSVSLPPPARLLHKIPLSCLLFSKLKSHSFRLFSDIRCSSPLIPITLHWTWSSLSVSLWWQGPQYWAVYSSCGCPTSLNPQATIPNTSWVVVACLCQNGILLALVQLDVYQDTMFLSDKLLSMQLIPPSMYCMQDAIHLQGQDFAFHFAEHHKTLLSPHLQLI